jgi:2-polyprenyl-3-methyl-5-hydroxy-6-metoxy-1,4-benzoquinol methylase
MFRCADCKTLYVGVLPARPEDEADYAGYYNERNLQVPVFVEHRLDEIVGELEHYRRMNRWLDIGCGAGALLKAARRGGWTAIGTEVSSSAAAAVRAQGFDVHLGEVDGLGLRDSDFDVVSLVEVVEHVPDPGAILASARRLLRPGGVLYVTTPHGRGISATLLRSRWSVVSPPEHLQLFSLRGLRTLVECCNLQVCSHQTHAVNPYELLSALTHRKAQHLAFDRVETAYALNQSLSASRRGKLVKALANGTLNVFELGDAIKMTAERPT